MKKLLALLLAVTTVFCLVSCGQKSDTPTGYQLASDPDVCGYYLYVPEDTWIASENNNGTFTQATVLSEDHSNLSVAVVEYTNAATVDEYWQSQKTEHGKFLSELTVEMQGELEYAKVEIDGTFGYRYIFTGKYGETVYKFQQILVPRTGGILSETKVYVFTFTASSAEAYDKHIDSLNSILKNFKFK